MRGAAAGLVTAASLGLAGAAAEQFRQRGTTVEPFDPGRASVLVTSGPNALTRNPMYVGMAGLLVANSLRRGSLLGLLPAAGFVAVMDRFQVAAEERALRQRFGDDYLAYQSAVPRWLDARSFGVRHSRASTRA